MLISHISRELARYNRVEGCLEDMSYIEQQVRLTALVPFLPEPAKGFLLQPVQSLHHKPLSRGGLHACTAATCRIPALGSQQNCSSTVGHALAQGLVLAQGACFSVLQKVLLACCPRRGFQCVGFPLAFFLRVGAPVGAPVPPPFKGGNSGSDKVLWWCVSTEFSADSTSSMRESPVGPCSACAQLQC